jgi:hypothetical protein
MSLPSLARQNSGIDRPNLGICPDCEGLISKQAESYPHCGRFIQRFNTSGTITIDRRGWSWTIAWGVLLAVIIPWLMMAALFVLFFVVGVGGAALSGSGARQSATSNR